MAAAADNTTTGGSARPLRVFAGTYNVRGRPEANDAGEMEPLPAEPLVAWLRDGLATGGGTPPDVFVLGLQEIVDLTALNVVVDSLTASPDHMARVEVWKRALQGALNSLPLDVAFTCVGQSSFVGLALFVFATAEVGASISQPQTGKVPTGFGGILGNKGSVMWRAVLGTYSMCVVASHFASGRGKVKERNECFATAVAARPFAMHPDPPPEEAAEGKADGAPVTTITAVPIDEAAAADNGPADDISKAANALAAANARSKHLAADAADGEGEGDPQTKDAVSAAPEPSSEEPVPPKPPLPTADTTAPPVTDQTAEGSDGSPSAAQAAAAAASEAFNRRWAQLTDAVSAGVEQVKAYREAQAEAQAKQAANAPTYLGVMDHDLVLWVGDFNYALLEDKVEAAAARAMLKGAAAPPPELKVHDQLTIERNQGNTFTSFLEAPLDFLPTYRVLIGADEYDEKRCPAWTDRVLWRARNYTGSPSVSPVHYGAVFAANLSDHKPVYALLDVCPPKQPRKSIVGDGPR